MVVYEIGVARMASRIWPYPAPPGPALGGPKTRVLAP